MLQLRVNITYPGKSTEKITTLFLFFCHFYYLHLSLPFFIKNMPTVVKNFNPLNANPTKLSNTLKQFVCNLSTNCLSVFYHFVGLALKGLKEIMIWCKN